jgi:hypothetical protein
MRDTMKKNLRKQSIQCWSCGRYHMHRYFPQRSDKVRIVHNVHQYATMEDMGIHVPRIYTTLDNNQDEFQLHMI